MRSNRIDLEKVVEKRTLNIFRIGCEETNYKILLNSPTTIEKLSRKFELTKMPTNRRVNQLVKAGLLRRELRTGKVEPTKLAKTFIKVIDTINSQVEDQLPKYLEQSSSI